MPHERVPAPVPGGYSRDYPALPPATLERRAPRQQEPRRDVFAPAAGEADLDALGTLVIKAGEVTTRAPTRGAFGPVPAPGRPGFRSGNGPQIRSRTLLLA
ncbi:hypothetical protein GCM10009562_23910 [Nocardioides aquaticus]